MKILITGAGSGLGLALAAEAGRQGLEVVPCTFDVRDRQAIQTAAAQIGRLDALVNNAGVNHLVPLVGLQEEDWDRIVDTNAKGLYLVTQAFLSQLRASRGVVVNVISNAAYVPMTHSLAYNASKGAAAIMTRQLARELTKTDGITVFGISPNKMADTGMSRYIEQAVPQLRGWSPEQARAYQLAALPAGFETQPEWIAELVVWLLLAKHRHQYLTGCILELGA